MTNPLVGYNVSIQDNNLLPEGDPAQKFGCSIGPSSVDKPNVEVYGWGPNPLHAFEHARGLFEEAEKQRKAGDLETFCDQAVGKGPIPGKDFPI